MDLSHDLVPVILLHLPMRSVVRFRSVCKSWCNIIDSSSFTQSHFEIQSENNKGESLYLQFAGRSPWEFSILNADNGNNSHKGFPACHEFVNENFDWGFLTALAVNGLICMYSDSYLGLIALYNPCLDKFRTIQYHKRFRKVREDYTMSTFYDCPQSWAVGFGFDNVTKDYKVVQLLSFTDEFKPTYVEVYSRKTNTWRKLITDFPIDDYKLLQEIKSRNGSRAHWQTQRRQYRPSYDPMFEILSCNMQNEVFETISYPNFDDREVELSLMYVFAKDDDSFALFIYTSDKSRMEVWELRRRDIKRAWTHVTDIINDVPIMPRSVWLWPKAMWEKDGLVLLEYGSKQYSLIFYDYSMRKRIKAYKVPVYEEFLEFKGSLILP